MVSLLLRGAALLAVSAAAGAANAVAGGGTLLIFPTLIALGQPPLIANATNTAGIVPGSLGGTWGYRRELADSARWLWWLIPPSVVGGILGALLLVSTPVALFNRLAPLLVLFATLIFMLQGALRSRGSSGPVRPWAVALSQLFIATYGGYFGGGVGILLLAALGQLRLGNIHRMNALKTLATACVNGVAAALFSAQGLVRWPAAMVVAVGATAGGYYAADLARGLGQTFIRRVVVGIGLATAAVLIAKQW